MFLGTILSCDPLSDADQAPFQEREWACSVSLALKLAAAGRIRREACWAIHSLLSAKGFGELGH